MPASGLPTLTGHAGYFRGGWLDDLNAMLPRSLADGIPVWGCTWWPLVDAVNWASRDGIGPLASYLEPGGLVRLVPDRDGRFGPRAAARGGSPAPADLRMELMGSGCA